MVIQLQRNYEGISGSKEFSGSKELRYKKANAPHNNV